MIRRALAAAGSPVSAQSAAIFRIAFGAVGTLIAGRYLYYGWVGSLLVDPPLHFSYPGFDWVHPWQEPWMTLHVLAMALAGIGVAVGHHYRLSLAAFFGLFAYMELIDRTLYINHYYWIGITALLMIALPLNAEWSVDAARRPAKPRTVALGIVWVLRFQLAMVYVFAGLAKLNPDWLLRGEPLATWFGAQTDLPLVGSLMAHANVAIGASWAGALFDVTIIGWLLWKPTRLPAYIILVIFHTTTWILFPSIGLFPLIMSLGTLIFFAPDWPTQVRTRLHGPKPVPHARIVRPTQRRPSSTRFRLAALVFAGYASIMILIPLRDVADSSLRWTASGYQFAWRVMLTEKSGSVDFRVHDPETGATWVIDEPDGLTYRQRAIMSADPGLIRIAAIMIERNQQSTTDHNLEVRADAFVSLNGRPHARILDPTVDLTAVSDQRFVEAIAGRP